VKLDAHPNRSPISPAKVSHACGSGRLVRPTGSAIERTTELAEEVGHMGGVSHSAGDGRELDLHRYRLHTTDQAVAIFAGMPLLHEPGIRFSYSSYGYNLLGAADPAPEL
jgi:CubicO group peptidase (beta-lactamase class C family)